MIGSRLGPWVLDKEIGRGGMASVYRAHADPPPSVGPAVAAVKVLAPELAAEQGFVLRFEREIDIVRQLDHPNILRFYESGVDAGRPWFAMEHVAGPSYDAILDERGRLPWREVLDVACQVAPALKHAHDRGVVHRDLKPSNLLRASDPVRPDGPGLVKLGDFGIASLFAGRHLTVTGGVVGTAEFLSPEQAAGKPVTRRSDLYSLGVVLYTLLVGRPPFEGEMTDLLHKHRFARFDPPARFVPDMPPEFDAIVCELMEKDPDRRPADGAVLFRRLDAVRRKIDRIENAPTRAATRQTAAPENAPEVEDKVGPATLMSRLVRRELERQNRGGPVRRLLNHPVMLVLLLLLAVGGIIWAFWPPGEETLFRRAAAAMASADPDDWDRAGESLDTLDRDHPGHGHREEIAAMRRKLADHEAARAAARAARTAGPMSEAQWFFEDGMRRRQRGDADGARRTWRALAEAFGKTPSEEPWVRKANEELARLDAGADADRGRQLGPVREAAEKAKRLRAEGKAEEADAILRGLRELYAGDDEAQQILKD